jgi:hypothetical protein
LAKECEANPKPNVAVWPSQKADEMGARFAVPSALSVDTRTTGVPQ